MSLDVGTKCETCLPSASLETGLNMFVLCYKIKWAKERSNRESRGFVTEGVDGRMAEYIQTNTQGLHGSVVHATVKEYLKILNYLNYSNYYSSMHPCTHHRNISIIIIIIKKNKNKKK